MVVVFSYCGLVISNDQKTSKFVWPLQTLSKKSVFQIIQSNSITNVVNMFKIGPSVF